MKRMFSWCRLVLKQVATGRLQSVSLHLYSELYCRLTCFFLKKKNALTSVNTKQVRKINCLHSANSPGWLVKCLLENTFISSQAHVQVSQLAVYFYSSQPLKNISKTAVFLIVNMNNALFLYYYYYYSDYKHASNVTYVSKVQCIYQASYYTLLAS